MGRKKKLKPLVELAGDVPFPLTAMLEALHRRERLYDGRLQDCAKIASALRALGLRRKRFTQQARHYAESLALARRDSEELQEAIVDCRNAEGQDMDAQQREVARAMKVKHGLRRSNFRPMTGGERVVACRKARRVSVEKLRRRGLVRDHAPMCEAYCDDPVRVLTEFVANSVSQITLLREEMSTVITPRLEDRKKLRQELSAIKKDVEFVAESVVLAVQRDG